MSRVKGRDTKPELEVRSLAHKLGFRFRLGNRKLPGKPDLTFARFKKVVFVHGCFWHGHKNCRRAKLPTTNIKFWQGKISKNRCRDTKDIKSLKALGWKALTIWQCELKDTAKVKTKLIKFFKAAT